MTLAPSHLRQARSTRLALAVAATVGGVLSASSAYALSTNRTGNLFSGDEDIVLKTTAAREAKWALTNDYGERIEGTAPVVDGTIRISTYGLRYGRYTFEVEGDGQVVGGVVPPIVRIHPDLAPLIFAPFQEHWKDPGEALMWKQLGAWEVRFEYGFDGMNPARDTWVFDPYIDSYMKALADQGVRPSFKINGPPAWNDPTRTRDPNSHENKWGEPKDYGLYEQTVRAYAQHYKAFGLDRYYIINEPEAGGWWTGGWPGYHRFLAASNKAIKAVDKRLITIAPEMWSNNPGFLDPVLKSGNVEVVSGHYPLENNAGNIHGDFYFTRMKRTGVILPFINGEDFADWPSNLKMTAGSKNYPGIVGPATSMGVGPVMMVNLDVGAYRVVELHLTGNRKDPQPFARWKEGDVVPGPTLFQHRAVADEFAGVEVRRRLNEAPPSVMAWLYRRGHDNFLGAYVPIGQDSQLMEIATSARQLRIVDCFGNEQAAQPVDGKVRLLLTNAEIYVHGLGADDQFTFLPHQQNEMPAIADPASPVAVTGVAFRLALDGRDPDADLLHQALPTWKLLKAPEGMSIRPGSGLIEWMPKEAGQASVTVSLTDADGVSVEKSFTVDVKQAGTNLPPEFLSRPSPVAVKDGEYRYDLKATDPNGDGILYSVNGPEGMKLTNGVVTWLPGSTGVYPVWVIATDVRGARTVQQFELAVVPNPDRPAEGLSRPRIPDQLTVAASSADRVTLVWNPHTFAEHVVQRAASRTGPWQQLALTKDNWYTDNLPAGPAYYRVIARNAGGDSEPSEIVNGRNRAPIADAGPSVKLASPGTAALDARGSFDPEGKELKYQWRIVNAPRNSKATLDNPASAQTTLMADRPGRYVISLQVTDGEEMSNPDYAWVIVGGTGADRVAYGGPDRLATVGQRMTLQPVAFSPARKQSKWFWRWDASPLDAYTGIRDYTKQTASFIPQEPGVYQFNLYPMDGDSFGFPDTVRLIVAPADARESDQVK